MQTQIIETRPMSALWGEDETTEKVTLGQALREARKYRGLTGKQLGKNMGRKSGTQILEVERGIRSPSSQHVARVADALDITITYQPKIGWFWIPN